MSTIKKRSISIICMLALILSVFSIMPESATQKLKQTVHVIQAM